MRRLRPQANGDAWPLPRRPARALIGGRAARGHGDEPRDPRRPVERRPPREPGIDDDAHAVERDRGFGDGSGQHDAAAPVGRAPDRARLGGEVELSVQRQHGDIGHRILQLGAGALDLRDARQEGEDVAMFLVQRGQNLAHDAVLGSLARGGRTPADRQRVTAPGALDHRRAAEQIGEAGAVDRRAHHADREVRPQHGTGFERQRQPEIAVQPPLVRLVEQQRRDAGQLGIAQQFGDEQRLGHHDDAGVGGDFRAEPGAVADRPPDRLGQRRSHPFGRRAGGDPARTGD